MSRDFTLSKYEELLQAVVKNGYTCMSYQQFVTQPQHKSFILRHDVDKLPINSLKTAQLEAQLNLKGTYYFRIVKESFDEQIIAEISKLGHEIGYHYEDLTLCKGNKQKALDHFLKTLEKFRKIAAINTICMHGSPTSKFDNRTLWEKYDYKQYGIIAEPYFDTDFNSVFYITDTGRKWNSKASVRDHVSSHFNFNISNTDHFIELIENKALPDNIMLNIHPQRWTDNINLWIKELIMQNIKNPIKKLIYKK